MAPHLALATHRPLLAAAKPQRRDRRDDRQRIGLELQPTAQPSAVAVGTVVNRIRTAPTTVARPNRDRGRTERPRPGREPGTGKIMDAGTFDVPRHEEHAPQAPPPVAVAAAAATDPDHAATTGAVRIYSNPGPHQPRQKLRDPDHLTLPVGVTTSSTTGRGIRKTVTVTVRAGKPRH
jgi:hypothetical protein